uniref:Type II toxin-antitoxin system PemK/MazF family toxin n=1 Tax=Prevotella sp. GTC17262 TaxID=3236797 RepID=A0AB33JP17_9BACT
MIDDAKGILSELKDKMKEESCIKRGEDLCVGDIFEMDMDANDGLILTEGYPTRLKYVVVVGITSKGDAYGSYLINSEINFSKQDAVMMKYQYPLLQKNYPELLEYDSYLDCTDLFNLKRKKIVARKANKRGTLTKEDYHNVRELACNSELLSDHEKKLFGLNESVN